MTREQEISDARNNYGLNVRKGYPRIMDETDRYICNAFEAGAKWADEHPIDTLKIDYINKASMWLKYNAQHFCYISAHSGDAMINESKLATEFSRAMLEE